MNYELLLFTLNYYVTEGEILDWLKSYLYNRKQRVEVGPFLFNIYINDFPLQINSVFADDTSILVCHSYYEDFKKAFNHVLLHTCKWFQAKHLMLNVEKKVS